MCLPSDALLQHLPSYLGFSYLGCGVSLHGCSSKAQPLLLTLYEGYLLTTALPDLQCGMAPLGPPAPTQPRLLGCGVGPPGHRPWPRTCDCSSPPRPLALGLEAWGSSSRLPPLCVYIYIYVCVCVCVCVCILLHKYPSLPCLQTACFWLCWTFLKLHRQDFHLCLFRFLCTLVAL